MTQKPSNQEALIKSIVDTMYLAAVSINEKPYADPLKTRVFKITGEQAVVDTAIDEFVSSTRRVCLAYTTYPNTLEKIEEIYKRLMRITNPSKAMTLGPYLEGIAQFNMKELIGDSNIIVIHPNVNYRRFIEILDSTMDWAQTDHRVAFIVAEFTDVDIPPMSYQPNEHSSFQLPPSTCTPFFDPMTSAGKGPMNVCN